jgi:hypothetical protein
LIFLTLIIIGTRLTFEKAMGREISQQAEEIVGRFDAFLSLTLAKLNNQLMEGGQLDSVRLTDLQLSSRPEAVVIARHDHALEFLCPDPGDEPWQGILEQTPGPFESWFEIQDKIPVQADDNLGRGEFSELSLSIPGSLETRRHVMMIQRHEDGDVIFFIYSLDRLIKMFHREHLNISNPFVIFSGQGWLTYADIPISEELAEQIQVQLV